MNPNLFRFSRLLGFIFLTGVFACATPMARAQIDEPVVVTAQDLPSAYGAPASFSQSRFSPITNAYVLPPGAIYASVIYENDVVPYRKPDHDFTIETEFGLPYRINLAMETDIERFNGETQVKSFSLEGRYAFADWDKIPLNPTIFAEYKIGAGRILHDEGEPAPGSSFGPGGFDTSAETPDAYELRLLLSEDFFEKFEWAMNWFLEQEVGGDRGREWGFAQSLVMPLRLGGGKAVATSSTSDHKGVATNVAGAAAIREEFKVGIECQFRSFSDKGSRGDPYNSFVLGPTAAWRPCKNVRFDVSPLFGVTHNAPTMQLFLVASYYFGGSSGGEAESGEAPASTRNR